MVFIDGSPIIERIKYRAELMGHKCAGPVGVVAGFSKAMTVDEEGGNRDILAVATTDDLDLEEEVVLPGGADVSYFQQNKKVFVDHQYDTLSAVGVLRNLRKWRGPNGSEGWLARIHVPDSPENPLAMHVLALARAEGIGTSIGFEAVDYGRPTADESKRYPGAKSIVRRWKWLELSFTAMPCNVACQSRSGSADDSKRASSRELLVKSRAPVLAFSLFHLEAPMMEMPAPYLEVG